MIVFNSLLKQGLLSIDESTLAFENGKLTAKISMGGYTEVEALPSIADAKEGVTYLVPTGDYFTMYVVDKANAKWITLGTTANKSYEFGDGLVENNGVVTLDAKPKAIRDYFVNVDQSGAVVPYLAIQDSLDVNGDITTDSALKGETLEIGDTIGVDSVGLYDTRTTYPDDGKYVVNKYLLEERIKGLTLSVPTNVSQLNNDMQYSTMTQVVGIVNQGINLMVAKSGSTMTGALTINNDLKALPLGYTTSLGVPAYGLQVSSTYGLQLFGTHFLNGTLWGDDGLKIVSNNLSLNSLDEAFISSDYANTTTFRAMPNDGVQATYQFQGWGWDDVSHTTKSPRLGVRLLKPNQATALESTSVLNMSEGDNRWVSLSGGTMTGYLNIPSPTASTHPTTKSYVDNLFGSGGGGLQNKATGVYSLSILGNSTTSNYSVTIGANANANASGSTALGYYAYTSGSFSIALGYCTVASGTSSTALGHGTTASGYYSTALGFKATSSEKGVTAISAWNDSGNAKTQFKIIGKGSTASTNKLGGKSGIEYEEYNSSGTITNSGAISFEALVSGGGGGGGSVSVDTALSTTSTNPVQNKVVTNAINGKQATLVSGTNIKTINGYSLLGSGDITISGGGEPAPPLSFGRGLGFNSGKLEVNVAYGGGIDFDENGALVVIGGGSGVSVDTYLSTTSTNPVQNKVVTNAIERKQNTLVSGTNIKTINGESLLGSGNITISGGGSGGLENLATGNNSLSVLGVATTSYFSTSVGYSANASGYDSTALGASSTARSDYSTALGYSAYAEGNSSIALGNVAKADYLGTSGIAIGSYAKTNGYGAIAAGSNTVSTAMFSATFGYNTKIYDKSVTSIGAWAENAYALRTQLYVIAEGSPLSNQYLSGRAGLAYAVWGDNEIFPNGKVKEGKIIAFKDLFANGIDFVPSTEESSGCCGC